MSFLGDALKLHRVFVAFVILFSLLFLSQVSV